MIPRKIHYCWFGKNNLPESARKCIDSWKKFFPDYEIIEWNESNYKIENKCEYVKEAYNEKKWAFVSDYARFDILYNYGGVYFDTDVEVIKSFSNIIEKGAFMGKEMQMGEQKELEVNPGLGLASEPNKRLYKEILDYYDQIHFDSKNPITICEHTTNILKKYKYKGNFDIEKIEDVYIYPPEFFCPMNYYSGDINITNNTYSIHRYTASWHTAKEIKFKNIERRYIKKYGEKIRTNIIFRVYKNIYCNGIIGTINKIGEKINEKIKKSWNINISKRP